MSTPESVAKGSQTVSLADEEGVKDILVSAVFGLWDIVNNLTRLRPSKRERFRVTIFGSARAKPGTYVYDEVKRVAADLAVTEIHQFGGASIQIARRLRAMLENLIQTLPEERATSLRQELKLLQRSAERFFTEPEDRALADISDFQGVGGKPGRGQANRQVTEVTPP